MSNLFSANRAPVETGRAASPLGGMPGILVVDDEISVRTLLDVALRREGYPVWVAADGEQALELFLSHRHEIGLVFLDVRMPNLDGPQTLQAMRRLEPEIRCCFMSGQSGQYSIEELEELGAAQIFRKPFRIAEVLQVVEQLMTGIPQLGA